MPSTLGGRQLLAVMAALGNPHRIRVIAVLGERRMYVSELARELSISRPLVQVHLKKLQLAGLVQSHVEMTADGKAVHYYELEPFQFELTPAVVTKAAATLPTMLPRRDPHT